MPNAQQRMEILLRLERGEITPAEAEQLLSDIQDLPPASNTRMGILEQVERGQLSADEATRRLLQPAAPSHSAPLATVIEESAEFDDEYVSFAPVNTKSRFGKFLFVTGLVITIGTAVWMGSSLQNNGLNFWFFCLWFPFAVGLATLVIGWAARNGQLMRLRVGSHKGNENFKLDLPLPLGVIQAAMRFGGDRVKVNRNKPPHAEEG